jgi:hypothetical protein
LCPVRQTIINIPLKSPSSALAQSPPPQFPTSRCNKKITIC